MIEKINIEKIVSMQNGNLFSQKVTAKLLAEKFNELADVVNAMQPTVIINNSTERITEPTETLSDAVTEVVVVEEKESADTTEEGARLKLADVEPIETKERLVEFCNVNNIEYKKSWGFDRLKAEVIKQLEG